MSEVLQQFCGVSMVTDPAAVSGGTRRSWRARRPLEDSVGGVPDDVVQHAAGFDVFHHIHYAFRGADQLAVSRRSRRPRRSLNASSRVCPSILEETLRFYVISYSDRHTRVVTQLSRWSRRARGTRKSEHGSTQSVAFDVILPFSSHYLSVAVVSEGN